MLRYLLLNHFRSFFGKRDFYIYFIILTFFIVLGSYIVYPYVFAYGGYFLCWIFFILSLQKQRKDLEHLRWFHKKHDRLLFGEYSFYSLPLLFLWCFTGQWYWALVFLILLPILIWLPILKQVVWSYPFHLFTPFLTVGFRKYRWLLLYPIALFLFGKGYLVNNPGLYTFSLVIFFMMMIAAIMSPEPYEHIVSSKYIGKRYCRKKWKSTAVNLSIALLPQLLFLVFIDYIYWSLWFFALLVSFIAVLVKYAFFFNPLHKL